MAEDIDKLKKAVKLAADLAESVEEKLEDGITLEEGISFAVELLPLVEIIKARKEIGAEVLDLTDEEIAELVEYAKQEFDIDNDLAEQKVESVIDWLAQTYDTFTVLKQKAE